MRQTRQNPPAQIGDILVPKNVDEMKRSISQGSGIVCFKQEGDYQKIYFEGNLYGASNVNRYEEKVIHAAGRAAMSYPTTAMMGVSNEEYTSQFVKIGEIDYSPDRKPMFIVDLFPEMLSKLSEWAPKSLENYEFVWSREGKDTWHKKSFEASSAKDAIRQMESHVKELETTGDKVVVDHPFYRGAPDVQNKDILTLLEHKSNTLSVMFNNKVWEPDQLPNFDPHSGFYSPN